MSIHWQFSGVPCMFYYSFKTYLSPYKVMVLFPGIFIMWREFFRGKIIFIQQLSYFEWYVCNLVHSFFKKVISVPFLVLYHCYWGRSQINSRRIPNLLKLADYEELAWGFRPIRNEWIFWMNNDIFFLSMGHSRVAPSLCFKERLGGKLLRWKWFYIFMQIKLIITRKVLHLASFSNWESFVELENGLFQVVLGP